MNEALVKRINDEDLSSYFSRCLVYIKGVVSAEIWSICFVIWKEQQGSFKLRAQVTHYVLIGR